MERAAKVKVYSWNVGGLSSCEDTAFLKRTEVKRMFREGRQLLKRSKVAIVLVVLQGMNIQSYPELQFRLQEFDIAE